MDKSKSYLKIATWVLALLFSLVVVVYLSVLVVLPATLAFMRGYFGVPGEVGLNPYLAKAITLTFGFLAAWMLVKYVFGWRLGRKRIVAFAGIVAIFLLYYFLMWGLTEGKQLSAYTDTIKAQKAQIAQCDTEKESLKLELTASKIKFTLCTSDVANLKQSASSADKSRQELAQAGAQAALDLAQCRAEAEAAQNSCAAARTKVAEDCDSELQALQRTHAQELAECDQEVKVLMRQGTRDLAALQTQVDAVEARERSAGGLLESMPATAIVPAVYTPPASSAPKPKSKAKVVVTEAKYGYDYSSRFPAVRFRALERNGVKAIFSRYTISVWSEGLWDFDTAAIARAKKTSPVRFEQETDDWGVPATSSVVKTFPLAQIHGTFSHPAWIEMVFYGRDANGNPLEFMVAGIFSGRTLVGWK